MGSHATAFLAEERARAARAGTHSREEHPARSCLRDRLSLDALGVGRGDLASRETEISQVLHWLYEAGADYLDEKGCSFAALVRQKRLLYRSDDKVDVVKLVVYTHTFIDFLW